jgi:hypothetical protein
VSEGFCSGACPARARRRPRFARDPAGLIPGPGRKGQQRPPAGFDRVTRTQQPRGLAALDKRHLELVQRYREPFATRLDVSFFQSPAAKEGGYAPAPRHVACHVVMLIPTWVGVRDFFSTMEVYRQTALRIRRHRVCLRREIGLRRRLCGLTGRRAELESWRALIAMGDTEMEPPE